MFYDGVCESSNYGFFEGSTCGMVERMTEKYLEWTYSPYFPRARILKTEFTVFTPSSCNDTNIQHPWRLSKPIWLPQHLESSCVHQGWKRTALQRYYNILPQKIMPFWLPFARCKRSNSLVRTCDPQNMAKWMNQRYLILKERTLLFLCPFYTSFNSH